MRDLLVEYFVPKHLGINHLNRQMVERNLAIPNALFGNFEGIDRPIIIFDGTYCYIEKSSNYLYQKRTYSMHKYRNLVKPFLMVCTDGHIFDVLGPYPATTSDADIIKTGFSNESPYGNTFFRAMLLYWIGASVIHYPCCMKVDIGHMCLLH